MHLATPDSAEEAGLWRRVREQGDAEARQRLLDFHLPYARVLAGHYFSRRYNDEVEFADYLQLACVGMLEAMERYDPARGVQFRTFAARRMHGAILGGLERLTEKQQQIAARQRLRAERLKEVRASAGEDGAGKSSDPRHLLRFVSEVGIGLALCWLLEDTAMVQAPGASTTVPFYQSSAMKQLRERLLHAVDALPPQERTVLRSHYLQDMPFEQVAAALQLTRGRISQIHKQALLHLRSLVRDDADWDVSF